MLKIYRAELIDGKWNNITELPFYSDQNSTPHLVLNASENMMYFVSNRSGGFGESDIWIVYVISTRFGISENLGADINIDRKTRNIIVDDSLSLFEKDYTAKSTTNRMNDGY